ncbi:GFA family protein [Nisaea sp.]|uniref:GFA family protein n=1 Tax=Nisaea sp. TaxID=2024842 RepID=UPI0032633D84
MNAPKLPLEGSCLCGSVQVRVTEQPLLTLACHCKDCQKLSASAYSLTVMFPAEGFSVTGELVTGGLRTEQREHNFCAKCLNFIFTRIKGADTRMNLRASVLDDLTWFEPFIELMTEEKLSWANVPAVHSFARFPGSKEELEAFLLDYSKR